MPGGGEKAFWDSLAVSLPAVKTPTTSIGLTVLSVPISHQTATETLAFSHHILPLNRIDVAFKVVFVLTARVPETST